NGKGVRTVEYNAEEGLMTVSGEVNPNKLLSKIQKLGKEAQLISVQNHSLLDDSPDTSQFETEQVFLSQHDKEVEMVRSRQSKCSFLQCFFRIKSSKVKVQPSTSSAPVRETRNWQRGLENGRAWGSFPSRAPPPHGHLPPYPPPYFVMGQPPMPPPPTLHFQPLPPQMVNPTLHYPRF
ncbi:PREDICTED: uncharacterized protein LOC104817623, partial [Tarenaya hassleriana]|uniref:uncharacterized protein LOC104817623 n=1 Tax=Tarenaya hassleriana TaxID=28532 RepID=UPI00053C3222